MSDQKNISASKMVEESSKNATPKEKLKQRLRVLQLYRKPQHERDRIRNRLEKQYNKTKSSAKRDKIEKEIELLDDIEEYYYVKEYDTIED